MSKPEDYEFAQAIEVVAGNPSEQELAAVIAVLQEARKQQDSAARVPHSTWSKNEQILRAGIVVGNGQWGSKYKQGL
jgi:dihydropteroate synthase